jgi:hypothetical protein
LILLTVPVADMRHWTHSLNVEELCLTGGPHTTHPLLRSIVYKEGKPELDGFLYFGQMPATTTDPVQVVVLHDARSSTTQSMPVLSVTGACSMVLNCVSACFWQARKQRRDAANTRVEGIRNFFIVGSLR